MPNVKCPDCGEIDWREKDAYGNYTCQKCGCTWGSGNSAAKRRPKRYDDGRSFDMARIGTSAAADLIFGRRAR